MMTETAAAAQVPLFGHVQVAESYRARRAEERIEREIRRADTRIGTSYMDFRGNVSPPDIPDWHDVFDSAWLRSTSPLEIASASEVRMVDLFSGCGAMTLGASEACRALGARSTPLLAVDTSQAALSVFGANFPTAELCADSVSTILDREPGEAVSQAERALRERLRGVDLLLGGPPCQGHSDLNNHTRRADPRNSLYSKMARFAEVIGPRHILIENVPGVVHDQGGVVDKTVEVLHRLGYRVTGHMLQASEFGVAQNRRRFFLTASLEDTPDASALASLKVTHARPLSWAIEDLLDVRGKAPFDSSAQHSPRNQQRIQYLFAHGLHDLPDEERPPCHRDKRHSYSSVYGRMYWDRPTQTLTTGFGSTGQGRYVHPLRPRTLTPHEAARVQFIPDFFRFPVEGRRALQEMIGNAVPPKLAYVLVLCLLARTW